MTELAPADRRYDTNGDGRLDAFDTNQVSHDLQLQSLWRVPAAAVS